MDFKRLRARLANAWSVLCGRETVCKDRRAHKLSIVYSISTSPVPVSSTSYVESSIGS